MKHSKLLAVCAGLAIVVAVNLRAPRQSTLPPVVASSAIEAALERPLPEVHLEGQSLDQAIQKLQRLWGVPIVVDWEELADSGLRPSTLTSFHGRRVTLIDTLDSIFNGHLGEPDVLLHNDSLPGVRADWTISNGAIRIIRADLAAAKLIVRIYPVLDLIDSAAPPPPPPPTSAPSVAGGGLFGPTRPSPSFDDERAEELTRFIMTEVAPDTWFDNGGNCRIQYIAGRLVVVQTWRRQRQIREILNCLREPAALPQPIVASGLVPAPGPAPQAYLWSERRQRWLLNERSEVYAALMRELPPLTFESVPLDQALARVARLADADIWLDRQNLKERSVDPARLVSAHLNGATLADALSLLLRSHPVEDALAYRVDGRVITVCTPGQADEAMITRVYDMRDWLRPSPSTDNPATTTGNTKIRLPQDLKGAIQSSVDPLSWQPYGRGNVSEVNGLLIITQTWENQHQIARLLATLRNAVNGAPAPQTRPTTTSEPLHRDH